MLARCSVIRVANLIELSQLFLFIKVSSDQREATASNEIRNKNKSVAEE
jgi:hypothetical protein